MGGGWTQTPSPTPPQLPPDVSRGYAHIFVPLISWFFFLLLSVYRAPKFGRVHNCSHFISHSKKFNNTTFLTVLKYICKGLGQNQYCTIMYVVIFLAIIEDRKLKFALKKKWLLFSEILIFSLSFATCWCCHQCSFS